MVKKVVFIALYLLFALILLLNRSTIMDWMESETAWYWDIALMTLGFAIALVPAIPFGIFAAAVGAKYGTGWGMGINLIVSSIGAITLFAFVRTAITPQERVRISGMKGMVHLTRLAERNAFAAVLIARLLPFIPSQVINVIAAITRMSWKPFVMATLLGKIPFYLLVTLLGDQWVNGMDIQTFLIVLGVYGLFLIVVWTVYRWQS